MKKETQDTIIIMSIIILVILTLSFFMFKYVDKLKIEIEFERDKCYELNECAVYGCLSQYASGRFATNYLIQEQNCLLRRGLE